MTTLKDACHDMNDDIVKDGVDELGTCEDGVTDERPDTVSVSVERAPERAVTETNVYRSRVGRTVKRHEYSHINRDNIQLSQIKKQLRRENPDVSSKKLREKFNAQKKNLKESGFRDVFRRLTGAMFSQISKDGKYAQVNLKEGVKRHGYRRLIGRAVPIR